MLRFKTPPCTFYDGGLGIVHQLHLSGLDSGGRERSKSVLQGSYPFG